MYKVKANLIIKLAIIISALIFQGCSSSKDNSPIKRAPTKNPNNLSLAQAKQMSAAQDALSVKRADSNYDTYQNYQSIDAPISLKEMKKLKRRPVLNIQELNNLMDNNANNKPRENHHLDNVKAPCIEENCNLQEIIKYNKAKNSNKPTKIEKPHNKIEAQPKLEPVLAAPIIEKPVLPIVNVPMVSAPIIKKPSEAVQEKAPAPIAPMPIAPAPKKPSEVIEEKMPAPKAPAPIPAVPAFKKPLDTAEEKITPAPAALPPIATSKLVEAEAQNNKISTINNLLVKCYVNIKNKIYSLFGKREN
jgi:hypothetical protein